MRARNIYSGPDFAGIVISRQGTARRGAIAHRCRGPERISLEPVNDRIDRIVLQQPDKLALISVDQIVAWRSIETLEALKVGRHLRRDITRMGDRKGARLCRSIAAHRRSLDVKARPEDLLPITDGVALRNRAERRIHRVAGVYRCFDD